MNRDIPVQCGGRGPEGEEVLTVAIPVTVSLMKREANISATPHTCPHNTGGHSQRCKASHPNTDKKGDGVACPFSFDYPHAQNSNPYWTPPAELIEPMREMGASVVYTVVHRTRGGVSEGAITWTSYESPSAYAKWRTPKMIEWYDTIAQNVSDKLAIELVTSPQAVISHLLGEIRKLTSRARRE